MPSPVLGLDLSLRAAGIALVYDTPGLAITSTVGSKLESDARLREKTWRHVSIANEIIRTAKLHDVTSVAVEDYAFSRRSSSSHVLAELGGLVKAQLLLACGVTAVPITASSARKFLLGKDTADKKLVNKKLVSMGYKPANLDESDAIAIGYVMNAYVNRRSSFFKKHELDLFERIDQKLG